MRQLSLAKALRIISILSIPQFSASILKSVHATKTDIDSNLLGADSSSKSQLKMRMMPARKLMDFTKNHNITQLTRRRRSPKSSSARSRQGNPYNSASYESSDSASAENPYNYEPNAVSRRNSVKRRNSPRDSRQPRGYAGASSTSRDELHGLFNKQVITGIPDLSDPCFRRYANSIIVNAQPYERRSSISLINCKTQCLRSQIGTYSCRSFVYDNVNQVCDLFAHVGDQSPARLLRFQTRDYFEPTAAISCSPPPTAETYLNNNSNQQQQPQPVSSAFGSANHGSNGLLSYTLSNTKVTEPYRVKSADRDDPNSTANFIAHAEASDGDVTVAESSCGGAQLSRFLKTVDFELYAHDDARVAKVTLSECLDLCASNLATRASTPNNAVKCNSLEYNTHEEECILSVETAVPLGNGQLRQKAGTDYYEKLCIDEKLATECQSQVYIRFPQMILVGFAETVVDAPTLQHCFDNCLNSKRLYGFHCISGMFYFEEPQLNCILNTEDRMSQPDLFTVENSDLVDYFETQCQANAPAAAVTGVPQPQQARANGRRFTQSPPRGDESFLNRDFVDKPPNDSRRQKISAPLKFDATNTARTLTLPVSSSLDAFPSAAFPYNLPTAAVVGHWSAWTDCAAPEPVVPPSVGINGALFARGSQTRRKLCGKEERVCGRESRFCEFAVADPDAPEPSTIKSQRAFAAQPTVEMSASKEKMAKALRRANCPIGVCCAVFGGCKVGVRRVPAKNQLEWCANPCAPTADSAAADGGVLLAVDSALAITP